MKTSRARAGRAIRVAASRGLCELGFDVWVDMSVDAGSDIGMGRGSIAAGSDAGSVTRRLVRVGVPPTAFALALALAGCATTRPQTAPPVDSTAVERGTDPVAEQVVRESNAVADDSSRFPELEPAPILAPTPPRTATASLGRYDARRDASLRLVIAGLEADSAGDASRALASYQRAASLDATNPIAFLALARHHVAAGRPEDASAFLDQARALFESEGEVGAEVDVFGLGLRAWIDRAEGRDAEADARFEAARELSPEIWQDELLSPAELR